jgi:hypothetical protein
LKELGRKTLNRIVAQSSHVTPCAQKGPKKTPG